MNSESRNDRVAIPRHPTAKDVRAYMEFLAEEHPELLDAIDRVSEAFMTDVESTPAQELD